MNEWLAIKFSTDSRRDPVAWIHKEWYQKGLVILFSGSTRDLQAFLSTEFAVTNDTFQFRTRCLKSLASEEAVAHPIVEKHRPLLNYLHREPEALPDAMQVIVSEDKDRKEAFFAVPMNEHSGAYIYPWLSIESDYAELESLSFSGCSQFVTAQCLLGASLKGIIDNDSEIPIIKHDINLGGQKIAGIKVERDNLYYSQIMRQELQHTLEVVKHFAVTQEPKLLVHLPYLDYIIFGVRLYLHGNMERSALIELAVAVLEEWLSYKEVVAQCGAEAKVEVTICSPFDALIQGIEITASTDLKLVTLEILDRLGLKDIEPNAKTQHQDVLDFVSFCLYQLSGVDISIEHPTIGRGKPIAISSNKFKANAAFEPERNEHEARTWQHFSELSINRIRSKEQLTVEVLLHIANSSVIGFATQGHTDGKVASILPMSEKQIQVGYSQIHQTETTYPVVINLTVPDSVSCVTKHSYRTEDKKSGKVTGPKGSIFYMEVDSVVTEKLLQVGSGISIKEAYANVIRTSKKEPVINDTAKIPSADTTELNSSSSATSSSASSFENPSLLRLSESTGGSVSLLSSPMPPQLNAKPGIDPEEVATYLEFQAFQRFKELKRSIPCENGLSQGAVASGLLSANYKISALPRMPQGLTFDNLSNK